MAIILISTLVSSPVAYAVGPTAVGFGTAGGFAVLAGSAITNTGLTVINGDIGISPDNTVTGFGPGIVNGVQYIADSTALSAKAALVTAYNDAAGQTPVTTIPSELGATTIGPGIYDSADGTFQITGALRLDASGNPGAVFIFKSASTLITAVSSSIVLEGDAQACNVFWQVGSSATLGVNSTFKGSLLALTSVTLDTGAEVEGRVLAQNGAVTLDSNVVSVPDCASVTPDPDPGTDPDPIVQSSSGSNSRSGGRSGVNRIFPYPPTTVSNYDPIIIIDSPVTPHMPNSGIGPDEVTETSRPLLGPHSRLIIPAIGVNAKIGYAGLLPDGSMDAPISPDDVSVYSEGPVPGEKGSSVITGHYGWFQKRAAVFDNLSDLVIGDIVSYEDIDGNIISFAVKEKRVYYATADTSEIFHSEQGTRLNLVSCFGAWDPISQSYGKRLVVFTELIEQ
ncbi:MAG: ice-binding family protein [bacterium]|nr:ice-binding family protein [bacterium]